MRGVGGHGSPEFSPALGWFSTFRFSWTKQNENLLVFAENEAQFENDDADVNGKLPAGRSRVPLV